MKVVFFRHGHYDYDKGSDNTEPLNAIGIEKMRIGKKEIQSMLQTSTRCITSPVKRALESAEILLEDTDISPVEVQFLHEDEWWDASEEILEYLQSECEGVEVLIIMTHQPTLEELGEVISPEARSVSRFLMGPKKGGNVVVDYPEEFILK